MARDGVFAWRFYSVAAMRLEQLFEFSSAYPMLPDPAVRPRSKVCGFILEKGSRPGEAVGERQTGMSESCLAGMKKAPQCGALDDR